MKYVIYYVIAINLVAFVIMYFDKRRARRHGWRISEMTLFVLAIILGSPGILLGMYAFRHKTKHPKFIYGIPLILVIQLILIYKFMIK